MSNTFKRVKVVGQVLFSGALLALLFYYTDWDAFLNVLQGANLILVVLSALLFFTSIWLSILRWSIVLRRHAITMRFTSLFHLYLAGSFFNNFLPTSVGGDVYKYLSLSKKFPENKKGILSSILVERGVGFFALFFANIVVYLFIFTALPDPRVWIIEGIIIAGLVAAWICFFAREPLFTLLEKLHVQSGIYTKFIGFTRELLHLQTGEFWRMAFYSVVFILNNALGLWLLFVAFGTYVNPLYIILFMTITQIMGVLPVSFNSIGVTEGLYVFLFTLVGVDPEISLAVALTARVSLIITSSFGGISYLLHTRLIK